MTTQNTTPATCRKSASATKARSPKSGAKTKLEAKAKTRNASPRADLYQQVTDKIVASLEQGVLPWRKPWRTADKLAGSLMPVNATTGRSYQGVNILLLWIAAEERGYTQNRWLTYLQAQQAGGQVRKGETGTLVVVYKPLERQAEDCSGNKLFDAEGEAVMEQRSMLKSLTLFNVAQCDGLPEQVAGLLPAPLSQEDFDTLTTPVCNDVITVINATGVQVTSMPQNRAFYRSSTDQIVLPLSGQFCTEADHWSTVLHELVHASGHKKRLDREGITSTSRKTGDPVYAFEELIAEMGSAFLCAVLGVYGEVQHDSYINGWLKALKDDKRALFRACRLAREAAEYLLAPLNGDNEPQQPESAQQEKVA